MSEQENLFDLSEYTDWEEKWVGMPEFNQKDLTPDKQLKINFESKDDLEKFAELIGQKITYKTKSIWFPKQEQGDDCKARWYENQDKVNPKYPVYIISKGRWKSRLTSKALEEMDVPYHIVVEPQEYDKYAEYIDEEKIYELPFSNLGKGSIPARNWVLNHSRKNGDERHWILDDNLYRFLRLNNNLRIPVKSGATFRAIEDFVDRYKNVALAGMQYDTFAHRRVKMPPFRLNTRIYSIILVNNSIPFEWRGRYNEDTDLSLRCLKDGWCTVLFNAFLAKKVETMVMSGGNTDNVYTDNDYRKKFAEALKEKHPNVVDVVWKFGRWHHSVNYKPFKDNKLVLKDNITLPNNTNNYGMILRKRDEENK